MLHYQLNYLTKSKLISFDINKLFNQVVKLVQQEMKLDIDLWFDVVIVNEKRMQEINHKFRHKNQVTDVITFAFWDNQMIKTQLLGEIYLCPEFINKVAIEQQMTFKQNFALNFIHGLLHLFQFDHMNEKDAKLMFSKQQKIFERLKI
ncbi:MAG: rRNA maturation RNase YbeY [Mycoplasma sp.]